MPSIYEYISEKVDWNTTEDSHSKKVFKSTSVAEDDYNTLISFYNTMKSTDDYAVYKKAFEGICKYCHIAPQGTIITKVKIKSGKEKDKNTVIVEYSYNTKKITLEEDQKLYHMTKVAGISALNPSFKARAGYFYYKPRVYFTIHKSMPKFLADQTGDVHKYECKENIKDVYVDPLVYSKYQGAVYVETNKPIKVEEMGINK